MVTILSGCFPFLPKKEEAEKRGLGVVTVAHPAQPFRDAVIILRDGFIPDGFSKKRAGFNLLNYHVQNVNPGFYSFCHSLLHLPTIII